MSSSYKSWTKEEDERLIKVLEMMKERGEVEDVGAPPGSNGAQTSKSKFWTDVSRQVTQRSAKQCRERWKNSLDPSIAQASWSIEEDLTLLRWQDELGNKWSQIASYMPGRTENGVKTRFKSIERARKRQWSPQDDALLLQLYRQHGPQWLTIQRLLPSRSVHGVKVRYRSLISGTTQKSVPLGNAEQSLPYDFRTYWDKGNKQLSASKQRTTTDRTIQYGQYPPHQEHAYHSQQEEPHHKNQYHQHQRQPQQSTQEYRQTQIEPQHHYQQQHHPQREHAPYPSHIQYNYRVPPQQMPHNGQQDSGNKLEYDQPLQGTKQERTVYQDDGVLKPPRAKRVKKIDLYVSMISNSEDNFSHNSSKGGQTNALGHGNNLLVRGPSIVPGFIPGPEQTAKLAGITAYSQQRRQRFTSKTDEALGNVSPRGPLRKDTSQSFPDEKPYSPVFHFSSGTKHLVREQAHAPELTQLPPSSFQQSAPGPGLPQVENQYTNHHEQRAEQPIHSRLPQEDVGKQGPQPSQNSGNFASIIGDMLETARNASGIPAGEVDEFENSLVDILEDVDDAPLLPFHAEN